VSVVHQRAALGKLVDVGSLYFRMKVHATDPVVLVVDSDEQDIGLFGRSQAGKSKDGKDEG